VTLRSVSQARKRGEGTAHLALLIDKVELDYLALVIRAAAGERLTRGQLARDPAEVLVGKPAPMRVGGPASVADFRVARDQVCIEEGEREALSSCPRPALLMGGAGSDPPASGPPDFPLAFALRCKERASARARPARSSPDERWLAGPRASCPSSEKIGGAAGDHLRWAGLNRPDKRTRARGGERACPFL
jgi:hypothetical protein